MAGGFTGLPEKWDDDDLTGELLCSLAVVRANRRGGPCEDDVESSAPFVGVLDDERPLLFR